MWDPVQRAILAELGHPPLVLADDPLLRALLRAAGRAPDAPDIARVLRVLLGAGVLYALSGPVQWLWRRRSGRA
jgi:hypothetical protein